MAAQFTTRDIEAGRARDTYASGIIPIPVGFDEKKLSKKVNMPPPRAPMTNPFHSPCRNIECMLAKVVKRFALVTLITFIALYLQACAPISVDSIGDPTSRLSTAATTPIVTEQFEVGNRLMAELLSQAFTEDAVPVRRMAQSGDPAYIPVLTELLRFGWRLYYNVWQDTLTALDTLAGNPEDEVPALDRDWA